MDEALIQEQERQLQKTGRYYEHVFWLCVPLLCMACYFYGARPLLLCGIALLTGNLCDRLVALLRHRVYTNKDLSNESFSLIIALLMPATVDIYVLVVAVLAGVLIGFGGFGGSSRSANPNAPRKGQDIRVRITLTFDEAVHGCKKNITITRQQECTECHGSGCAAGSSPETCPDCGGRGFVIRQQRTPFGVMQTQQPCSRCGGKGKLIKNPCKSCHGSGTIAVKKTLEANVPAGIDDDQGFRLSGMGNAGTNGGPAGDVIVAVTVQPSEVFQRDENNIYVVFPITSSQAVLGDTITVPSIDGKVEVNVPEGTQSGTTFRLRGKGIQYVNGRGRGDMYVKCEVEIPKKLSRTQREALKKFEGTLKEDNYEKRKGFFKKLKDMFNN